MRRMILTIGLAAVLAAPLALAPDEASSASCRDRKITGTLLGGVGGALLGSAVTDGAGGTVVGGLGGAVVGHEIGRSGCTRSRPVAYRERSPAPRRASSRASSRPAAPRPVRYVYYDQYGQPISSGPAPGSASYVPASYTYGDEQACRTETHRFYDNRGLLVERPTQVCDR